jgi:hypothetical protein
MTKVSVPLGVCMLIGIITSVFDIRPHTRQFRVRNARAANQNFETK